MVFELVGELEWTQGNVTIVLFSHQNSKTSHGVVKTDEDGLSSRTTENLITLTPDDFESRKGTCSCGDWC